MMNERQQLGSLGEGLVAEWLKQQGFSVLCQNYRIRTGEVDVIAQRDEVLAFVEVKTRKKRYFPLANTVTRTKQLRVIKAAKYFLMINKITDRVIRFDVATVLFEYNKPSVNYIPNAFTA